MTDRDPHLFRHGGDWPDEVQAGAIPVELKPYLRENIEFMNEWYRIDWDNWMVWDQPGPKGKGKGKGLGKARSRFPQTGILVGVSLISDDPDLMAGARGMLGSTSFTYISITKSTLKLADADGF